MKGATVPIVGMVIFLQVNGVGTGNKYCRLLHNNIAEKQKLHVAKELQKFTQKDGKVSMCYSTR
jgi:hypothetical protein